MDDRMSGSVAERVTSRWGAVVLLAVGMGLIAGCPSEDDATPGGTSEPEDSVEDATGGDVPPPDLSEPDGGSDVADTGSGDAAPPAPGEFGAPCVTNTQCVSGWCVQTDAGPTCTRTCIDECPEGWGCVGVTNTGGDATFICMPSVTRLCEPCTTDGQCGAGICATYAEGQACTRPCGDQEPCPDGFDCVDPPDRGPAAATSRQCVPVTGSCTCSQKNHGTIRPCGSENEYGTCFGSQTCDGQTGWAPCSASAPAAEICDGLDNDCDGIADEGLTPPEQVCAITNDAGTCTGDWACLGPGGWKCSAATPAPEICNFQDDDCDGQTDEGFTEAGSGAYVHPEHCGGCGKSCVGVFPNGVPAGVIGADGPECAVAGCLPGFFLVGDVTCLPIPTQGNLCLPCVDDASCGVPGDRCLALGGGTFCARDCGVGSLHGTDCPAGYACTDVDGGRQCLPASGACDCLPQTEGVQKACTSANEHGTCLGVQQCTAAGWTDCTAVEPSAETCDGQDNDCDGLTDEGVVGPVEPCQTTWTDPQSGNVATCSGTWVCSPIGVPGWSCSAPQAGPETCDYKDNDCDGLVDEDFRRDGTGAYEHPDHCGVCGFSCAGVISNANAKCDASGAVPVCLVDTCYPGFYRASPTACLPVKDPGCQPCTGDAACQMPGARCLSIDGGGFCARDCGAGNVHGPEGECAAGYTCVAALDGSRQCRPISGSCSCLDAEDDEATRPCLRTNALGTCVGGQTCHVETGWTSCDATDPAAEECNGADDDCDGQVDEGISPPDAPCQQSNAAGTCVGAWHCAGPGGWGCDAKEPAPETCNSQDDNCDGSVDEAFRDPTTGLYDAPEHCGACGVSCSGVVPFASGTACSVASGKPRCVATACAVGYELVAGVGICVPEAGGGEPCSPCAVDAHCSGLAEGACIEIDGQGRCAAPCGAGCAEGMTCTDGRCVPTSGSCSCLTGDAGATRICVQQNGSGSCIGTQVCDPTASPGWSTCTAAVPADEVCDGVDNDCDGLVDEGLIHDPPGCAKDNAWGTCQGSYSCQGQAGWQCNAATPSPEVCDFLDNDCDGTADDPFRLGGNGPYVDDAHCGTCGVSCAGAIPNAAAHCVQSAGFPRCEVASCDPGYFAAGPLTCLPAQDTTCQPCQSDANCPTPGDRCLPLDGGSYCGRDCSAGNAHGTVEGFCPPDFVCTGLGGGVQQCVPPSGSCACLSGDAGTERSCANFNPSGVCFGTEVCAPASGWSVCDAAQPQAETCDGLDNNCNGIADEALVHVPPVCSSTNEHGTCTAPWICGGVGGWTCSVQDPVAEACDLLDNDCDGAVDEDFRDPVTGKYTTDAHCGACNVSCANAFPNATAACDGAQQPPRCVVVGCAEGFVNVGGTQCVPQVLGQCSPCQTSANCLFPGAVCSPLDDGTFCLNPCGPEGTCPEGFGCQADLCRPVTEACLCGASTVGIQKGCAETYTPAGASAYQCLGLQTCTASGWTPCALPAETCNHLDDDCDGQTDEDFISEEGYVTDDNCGACGNDCTLLVFAGAAGVCNTFVDPPICSVQCTENCFDVNANPSDGCECCDPAPIDLPDPEGYDANCDGMDGEKDGGVFVSKEGDDLLNDGTWLHPKRTIAAGIQAAVDLGRRDVYVATGVYQEAFDLRAGVGVYGGYSSDFRQRDSVLYEVAVIGPQPTDARPGAVNAVGIAGGAAGSTVFDGFTVFGASVLEGGGSSYAIYLRNVDGSVRVSNNTLYGGRGGKGFRGTDGVDGDDGLGGTPGVDALDLLAAYGVAEHECQPQNESPGGAGGVRACDGAPVDGGAGGRSLCPQWDSAADTTLAPRPASTGVPGANGGGVGGAAGWDVFHQAFQCLGYATFGGLEGLGGEPGAGGMSGASGPGCQDTAGQVTAGAWVPADAGPGAKGTHGAGGGGGGVGAGAWVHTSCFAKGFGYDNLGGSGGGGGAGGCAGLPGSPGTSGGGAFCVFVTFDVPPGSLPLLAGNVLHGGVGGDGGDGGNGGTGGSGGDGAFGGKGGGDFDPPEATYPAFKGGKGGKGGNGGHAGGGGGGCGGPAVGIFVHGADAASAGWGDGNTFPSSGVGGAGGHGGLSLGQPGGPGAQGSTSDVLLWGVTP